MAKELTHRNASTHLSQERVEHREWIGGRALTLLSHYWRHDDPVELTAAIGKDWADVLEGIPDQFIQRACIKYMRDVERSKPTPGCIYQLAIAMMPKPERVPTDNFAPDRNPEDRVTAEAAAAIMKDVGFRPKTFGKTT